jgi:hypothetical protein
MSKALWACSVCGEDFTRRSSAERHRNNIHQGRSSLVRFVEYLAGRASGLYPRPIDPPRLARRGRRPQFGKTSNSSDRTIADSTTKDFWWEFENNQSEMSSYSQPTSSNNDISKIIWNAIDEFNRKAQKVLQFKTLMSQLNNYSNTPFYMPVIQAPMNIPSETRFIGLSGGIILGYKGHVCEKCLSWRIEEIRDDEKRILSESNHTCDPQRLHEAQSVTDTPGTIYKRRQELISYLALFCVNNIFDQQELLNLAAVEIPPSVFDNRSDSYEEYVDLDILPSGTPDWAHGAVKEGKTVINRTDLAEFLNLFEATLGFFRLAIYGVKHYFFVYIAKGLDPRDIKYLKKFLDADTLITTSMSITMNNSVISKEWKDMFIDGRLTGIPPLRPDKSNFLSKNPTTFEVSENKLDNIRERHESGITMKYCDINKEWQWYVFIEESLAWPTPMFSVLLPSPLPPSESYSTIIRKIARSSK